MLDWVIGEKTIIRRMLHRVAVQCRNYSGLAVTASQFLSVEFRLISQKCQGIARAVGITGWSHPVIPSLERDPNKSSPVFLTFVAEGGRFKMEVNQQWTIGYPDNCGKFHINSSGSGRVKTKRKRSAEGC